MSEKEGTVISLVFAHCDGEPCVLRRGQEDIPPERRWTPDQVVAYLSGKEPVRQAMLKEHGL